MATTKSTKPMTVEEARNAMGEAERVLREYEERLAAEAAERAAQVAQERVERSRAIVAAFNDVDSALAARIDAAAEARNAVVESLDLSAILPAEAEYHGAVAASNVWRNLRNSAVYTLTEAGVYDWRTRPTDMPDRRERPVSLFGGTEDGYLGAAIRRQAQRRAEPILAEVLDALDLAHLAEEV